MGLDMYLEGSFSRRAYVRPTDQDYADMREGKEVTVKKSQALIDALESTGLQNAPIEHEWNHLTYVFLSGPGEKLTRYTNGLLIMFKKVMTTASVIMFQEKI